jgi:fused signal recognition particle receptor
MIDDPSKDEKATQLVKVANETKAQALALLVRSPREYEQVSEFRKNVKAKYNEIEGYRTYLKEPYLEGGRRVDEFFKPALLSLKQAEDAAKERLLKYEVEQKRIAAEEQRRLEEKARKEREVLEAKAKEERRKADEAAAEIQRKAEEARQAGDLARSIALRNQADKIVEKSEAKAINMESKAEQVVAPKVEAYIPPVQGQFSKTVWKARVLDKKAISDEYKVVDQAMLDKVAQATKGQLSVAGVEFYSEQVMVGRAK